MGHEVHVESSRPFIPILDPTSGAQYHLHPSSSLSLQPMNSFKPQAQVSLQFHRPTPHHPLLSLPLQKISISMEHSPKFKPYISHSSSRRRRTSTDSKLPRVRVLEKPVLLSAQSPLRR
ncbi:hypothetical protein ACFX10_010443 [Malus domestica]